MIAEYVGKTILAKIRKEFMEGNESLFGFSSHGKDFQTYAKLVGIDEFGIYIENSNYKIIPNGSKEPAIHTINFLVPWQFVITVGLFPNREFEGNLRNEPTLSIGFQR